MTSDNCTQAVFNGCHWLLMELDCRFGKAYTGINNKDFFFFFFFLLVVSQSIRFALALPTFSLVIFNC